MPLPARIDADDLEDINARALFLEWSRIDDLRPGNGIRLTAAGGYHELEEHINVHRYYLEQERGTEAPLWEAVTGWYDDVYLPVVQAIRDDKVLEKLQSKPKRRSTKTKTPERSETDLYLWIMNHLRQLRQSYGDDATTEDAMQDYIEQYAGEQHTKTSVAGAIRQRISSTLSRDGAG